MRISTQLSALALAVAALSATLSAQAQSIEVKVTGTITPAACVPAITGGGVIAYGNIAGDSLSMTSFNRLAEKDVPFTLTCSASTQVGVRVVDNQATSRVTGILGVGLVEDMNFGLGTSGTANIGGYALRLKQGTFTSGGVSVFNVTSATNGAVGSWAAPAAGGALSHNATALTSWSATAGGVPVGVTTLAGTLSAEAVLNRGDALPLTNAIPFEGQATLEVVYL